MPTADPRRGSTHVVNPTASVADEVAEVFGDQVVFPHREPLVPAQAEVLDNGALAVLRARFAEAIATRGAGGGQTGSTPLVWPPPWRAVTRLRRPNRST
jgi:hypothetical protein